MQKEIKGINESLAEVIYKNVSGKLRDFVDQYGADYKTITREWDSDSLEE